MLPGTGGTAGPIGLLTMYLSVLVLGSTAPRVSMATWITASIRIMYTMASYPYLADDRSGKAFRSND
jgi:hypothetical protein